MNIYEVLVIATFIMSAITMISQYIDNNATKVRDVLQLMNIRSCNEIKAYRNGRRLRTVELMKYLNSPVAQYSLEEGILYITIY